VYWIEEIAKERTAGAHEVTMRCVSHLTGLCRAASSASESPLPLRLAEVGTQLVRAKPALAPIMNLVNGLLLHTQQVASSRADDEVVRQEAIRYLESFQRSALDSLELIAERAVALLEPGCRVFTLSGSETVARTLERAHQFKVLREVVIAESRPMSEGTQLARRLGALGITVSLIVDAAAPMFVRECDVVMVGADAVGSTMFVNKIGTCCAVTSAKKAGRPRYALAAESKLVPTGWPFPDSEGDPREVIPQTWANVTARNPYFETLPVCDLTGVVTETGVYTGPSLTRRIARLRISPLLLPAFRPEVFV
jgi:translation initiation factor 2B subunit (eIF-2B alpha/beta/delta family)